MKIALATSNHVLPAGDLALMQALADQGLDVEAAVWSDPRQSWKRNAAVLVRSCWDYHLRVREFLDWVAYLHHSGIVVLNDPSLIRWNSNKTYLAELASRQIAIPETIFLKPTDLEFDLARECAMRQWSSAVVKPLVSASAHLTERKSSGLVRGPAMVQKYVASIETEGEWSLVFFNHQFSHAVIKKPRLGDFRVQSAFGGTVEVAQPSVEMLCLAKHVLRCLRWPAMFARVDLVTNGPSIELMELEVIEPELFLSLVPGSSARLAAEIVKHLSHKLQRNRRSRSSQTEPAD